MVTGGSIARLAATVALGALVAACQTTRERESAVAPELAHAYLDGKPEPLKRHLYVKLAQGKRNDVLNDMRIGLAALELGEDKLAEELFDDALGNIEIVYADNAQAAEARSLFTKELAKDFKGEPYERAMAYYYRGLLYLKAGDYDNARASFKGGFIQDGFADEDQHRADFGLLPYLQGWASRCRGNAATAEDDFREAQAINPAAPLPGPADTVLVLAETGSAPIKVSATDPNSTKPRHLKFRRVSATQTARVRLAQGTADLVRIEDVYRQAATRGGREFDTILAGKAQFKAAAGTVGDAALAGAVVAASYSANSRNREQRENAAAAAGAMLLVGLIAKAAAEATEPDADTRYWDNLPDRVHALTLPLPEDTRAVTVEFLAEDGAVVGAKEVAVSRAGACGLAWVRSQTAMPGWPRAPNSTAPEFMHTPIDLPPPPRPADPPADAEAGTPAKSET
ncbi:MAG: hypothetical protein AB1918_00315 [Pseudomonadota bacterium]